MSLDKLLKQVQEKGVDQSKATAGGGDYTPPEKGVTGARLVGYYEVGQHEFEFEGKKKTQNEVQLVFELIGKKHPPRVLDNGEKIPVRMTVVTNLSQNEKAWFYKWFSALRTEETHFIQLLGKPLLLEVEHEQGKRDKDKVFARIKKDSIRKPIISVPIVDENGEQTGDFEEKPFNVGPAITPLGGFVWDFADAESWDALYIPGEYEERKDKDGKVTHEARSKNVIQLKIASALNFKGLPCYDYAASKLVGDGKVTKEGVDALDKEVGDVDNTGPDEDDPMEGVV